MDKKLIEEFDKKQKSLHKRKKDSSRPPSGKAKHAKVIEPESQQPSTSYRDRAKERREGLNNDFELEPDDLMISNPIIANLQYDETEQAEDEQERRRQQIEDSKYLGGDVEHTHLVKGLDFALLEKIKNDQKLAEKLNEDKEKGHDMGFLGGSGSDSEEEEFRTEAILAASMSSSSKRHLIDIDKLKKGKSTEIIPCRTAIARRILNVLDEKWPAKSELFLPGRMTYTMPIDENCEDTSVTTILRSKADTSAQDENGGLDESDLALNQLINILGKIRRGATTAESSKKTRTWESDEMNDYGY